MAFRAFGLTGSIGTGKSTVSGRFRARKVPVVDADQLARRVVEQGQPALGEIVRQFGSALLEKDGTLARGRLAEIVFGNPGARAELESIIHPRVRALARAELGELGERGEALACYEAPLLIEVGLADELRPLVVVSAPHATQIARAAARDRVSRAAIEARVRAQMPLSDKIAMADYVIDNDGPLLMTLARADEVLEMICAELNIDPGRYPKPNR